MSNPTPSGTVVVLRDAPHLELLLLRRVPRRGQPVPWVFPGGKVEGADRLPGAALDDDARRAALRETQEEAGLSLAWGDLVPIARWITPPIQPRRFDTWFFAARVAPEARVSVDGTEIEGHRWLPPQSALDAHHAGELRLAPPTFVTVTWLAAFASASDALRVLPGRQPPPIHPQLHRVEGGTCMLYPGDAGYEPGRPDAAGSRHRLWVLESGWRYERDDAAVP